MLIGVSHALGQELFLKPDFRNAIYDPAPSIPGASVAQAQSVAVFSGSVGLPGNTNTPTDGALYLWRTVVGQSVSGESSRIPDADGNGLPDDWEVRYFGSIGVDPDADEDQDGMTNMAEYMAGTVPTSALSRFAFIGFSPHPDGGVQLAWASASNRLYQLERSTTIANGIWQPVLTNVLATPPTNWFHDRNAPLPGAAFYRLRLAP